MRYRRWRRRIVMGLLAMGTVAGFAAGFAGLHHRHHQRRAAFEDHVADVCVHAAERAADTGATRAAD